VCFRNVQKIFPLNFEQPAWFLGFGPDGTRAAQEQIYLTTELAGVMGHNQRLAFLENSYDIETSIKNYEDRDIRVAGIEENLATFRRSLAAECA
jgi:hypothetical protein